MPWVLFTAGRGPVECQLAINPIAEKFILAATQQGLSVDMLDIQSSDVGWFSCLLSVDGDGAAEYARSWHGTVEWKCESIIRNTKRKNWFIGVRVIDEPPPAALINDKDIRFETYRASGPGGQHVNTTNSAVRAIHVPSGITAQAQEERSQHRNKALAVARLAEHIAVHDADAKRAAEYRKWASHNNVVRGEPVKIFVGRTFRLQRSKKDEA